MGEGAEMAMEWELAREADLLGLEPEDGYWRTQDGRVVRIRDMTDQHLRNTILMLRRRGFRAGHSARANNHPKLRELHDELMIRDLERKAGIRR
jgi:hypothetical protein